MHLTSGVGRGWEGLWGGGGLARIKKRIIGKNLIKKNSKRLWKMWAKITIPKSYEA